jgi:hypothetical protein
VVVSFICGGNRSTWKKPQYRKNPPTCHNSLIVLHAPHTPQVPFTMPNKIYMLYIHIDIDIYNIRTLSVNIKFIYTRFRNRQISESSASFSGLFRSEYKWILYSTTMYVLCVYPAMSKKSEKLSYLNKKDRNKRHSSPFINVVKWVFFVVRFTLVSVSFLSAPFAVHSYRVPGKFISRLKSLFV